MMSSSPIVYPKPLIFIPVDKCMFCPRILNNNKHYQYVLKDRKGWYYCKHCKEHKFLKNLSKVLQEYKIIEWKSILTPEQLRQQQQYSEETPSSLSVKRSKHNIIEDDWTFDIIQPIKYSQTYSSWMIPVCKQDYSLGKLQDLSVLQSIPNNQTIPKIWDILNKIQTEISSKFPKLT